MDLKPQNILITVNHPKISGHVLKLADFGFAQTFSSNEIKHAMRGSPLYMAPEMFLGRPYDAKVDLWSVFIFIYFLFFSIIFQLFLKNFLGLLVSFCMNVYSAKLHTNRKV